MRSRLMHAFLIVVLVGTFGCECCKPDGPPARSEEDTVFESIKARYDAIAAQDVISPFDAGSVARTCHYDGPDPLERRVRDYGRSVIRAHADKFRGPLAKVKDLQPRNPRDLEEIGALGEMKKGAECALDLIGRPLVPDP